MRATPRVSVLVKSYNHRPYVEQAVRSVLAQGIQDFEILVLDDASSDGTPDVVAGIEDPRIDLQVSQINGGPALALKTLLEGAKGEYVAILNSDDFALPDRLERQVDWLDRNPAAAGVFTPVRPVDERGRALPDGDALDEPSRWPDHGRARWLRHFFFQGNCLAPSGMFRRKMLMAAGPPDPRFTNLHDLDLWVRLTTLHDIGFIADPLTAFRIRAGAKNLSAPRADTQLRVQFETAMILRHYARMPAALLHEIFAPELADEPLEGEAAVPSFVARMALKRPLPSYRLFALQTLFDAAESREDCERLRRLTGEIDLFNFLDSPINAYNRSFGVRLRRLLRRVRRS